MNAWRLFRVDRSATPRRGKPVFQQGACRTAHTHFEARNTRETSGSDVATTREWPANGRPMASRADPLACSDRVQGRILGGRVLPGCCIEVARASTGSRASVTIGARLGPMVWLRVSGLFGVLVVLPHWGCGGATNHADQGADAGGSSGTSSTTTAAGASASGGSVGSGGSGDAGSGASGGAATVGGGGSSATVGTTNSVFTVGGVAAAGGAGPEVPVADER